MNITYVNSHLLIYTHFHNAVFLEALARLARQLPNQLNQPSYKTNGIRAFLVCGYAGKCSLYHLCVTSEARVKFDTCRYCKFSSCLVIDLVSIDRPSHRSCLLCSLGCADRLKDLESLESQSSYTRCSSSSSSSLHYIQFNDCSQDEE